MEEKSFVKEINQMLRNSFKDDLNLLRKIENEINYDEGEVEIEVIEGKEQINRKSINDIELVKRIINFIESYYIDLPKIVGESLKNFKEVSEDGQQIRGLKFENLIEINSEKELIDQELHNEINHIKDLLKLFIQQKGEINDNQE